MTQRVASGRVYEGTVNTEALVDAVRVRIINWYDSACATTAANSDGRDDELRAPGVRQLLESGLGGALLRVPRESSRDAWTAGPPVRLLRDGGGSGRGAPATAGSAGQRSSHRRNRRVNRRERQRRSQRAAVTLDRGAGHVLASPPDAGFDKLVNLAVEHGSRVAGLEFGT